MEMSTESHEPSTESHEPSTQPEPTSKRRKAPTAKPEVDAHTRGDAAFELSLTGPGSLRRLAPQKWTKDEENRDVIDVRFTVEITGEECLDGVPYPNAVRELLAASQSVTEGVDVSTLKLKKTYASVLVLLSDPLFKARVTVANCLISTTPEVAIVKGRPRVRVGFTGTVFANDLLPLSRMLGRDITVVTEPAQQSLQL